MFNVSQIVQIQAEMVEQWHREPIQNRFEGLLQLVCQQHIYNFELWHQEDIARSPTATDQEIAAVKRRIDKLNQSRNDFIEQIDDWLANHLQAQQIQALADARQHTETPGSAVDRLSIMALRIFHYVEQTSRADASAEHLQKVQSRLQTCRLQHRDLARSLELLIDDILNCRAVHRIYRQFKMYNDPTLNPYLYKTPT